MQISEVTISVGELIGVPRVTVAGSVSGWECEAIYSVLTGIKDRGKSCVVLDVACAEFTPGDGDTRIVDMLRNAGREINIHVVCSNSPTSAFGQAALRHGVHLYRSADEIASRLVCDGSNSGGI